MTSLVVPPPDAEPWPTLGPEICDFIEDLLVFGPGDLRGQPAVIDDEKRAVIYRSYEVYPKGHPLAGRRRFNRVTISWRKGKAKTELAAWLAAVELHPEGPVRTDGWRREGKAWVPVGAPIRDPYIPMVAYTEEQGEELAYGALRIILGESEIADDFDIGLERILRADGTGKAVALASAPNSREGGRTTFQHFDETHLFTLPRLKKAHSTMLANLPKLTASDAWALETTTMYIPGRGSVAESSMDAARAVATARNPERSRHFFIHLGASADHDISTDKGLRAAITEASGPTVAKWTNYDGIISLFRQKDADIPHLRQVWLNQENEAGDQAFDLVTWKAHADPERVVAPKSWITLGWDGSRTEDGSALIATEVVTGFQWPIGIWERPYGLDNWEVPEEEVDLAIDDAFTDFNVWRLYADPPYWETAIARWAGKYGEKRVVRWPTYRKTPMAFALRNYDGAIRRGEVPHSGDPDLTRHIGNAVKLRIELRDEEGRHLWLIQKERPGSQKKMDGAMGATLSWEARTDALAAGIGEVKDERPPEVW